MNTYRNIKYELYGTSMIKLTNTAVTDDINYKEGETYPDGKRFISIPELYMANPTIYAKRFIDRMYEHKAYYDDLSLRKLKGDYKSRTGHTIEKMKEKS